jgi:hypothetical protein
MFGQNILPLSSESNSKPFKKPAKPGGKLRSAQLGLLFASAGFLIGLLIDPEDEGNMFLQNIGHIQTTRHHILKSNI